MDSELKFRTAQQEELSVRDTLEETTIDPMIYASPTGMYADRQSGTSTVTYYNHHYSGFNFHEQKRGGYQPLHLAQRVADVHANAIVGDCCVVGWNGLAVLRRNDSGKFVVRSMVKMEEKQTGDGEKELVLTPKESLPETAINNITTFGISSCTFFAVMSRNVVLVAHSDVGPLDALYKTVMQMDFQGDFKVFASRVRGFKTGDKEAKLVQRMIEHINPSEGHVIDRGDPDDLSGLNLLGHGEIGMTIDADNNTFHIMGDITKGQSYHNPGSAIPENYQMMDFQELKEIRM